MVNSNNLIDFQEIRIIEINVRDPESAALGALKLFQEGRLKPDIYEITVFDIEEGLGIEPPLFVYNKSTG